MDWALYSNPIRPEVDGEIDRLIQIAARAWAFGATRREVEEILEDAGATRETAKLVAQAGRVLAVSGKTR